MSAIDLSQSASTADQPIVDITLVDTNEQPSDQQVVESTSTVPEIEAKRGRKRKSTVWDYFVEIKSTVKGVEVPFLQCVCCGVKFTKSKTGTTSQLLRHVRECDKIKAKTGQLVDLTDKRQKRLGFLPVDSELASSFFHDPKHYDSRKIREIIAKMIIVHEYPFMMVEHIWFNILLKVLNPNYESVSRNTIKTECMRIYEVEKEKLKISLKNVSMVSLTSDCWTSCQTIGYICITIHYIDECWKMQRRIINFIELEPPHTGTFICDAISACLIDWNLHDKVSSITLDNASNNDVAASALRANFLSRGKLHFCGHFFHVRCCAHILNIMVQDGLREVQEIIHNIRESVKYLKKSPSRLHKFVEVAKQLGVSTTRSLTLDVPTRWNSTYLMLESAFTYRNVFSQYATRDTTYKWCPNDLDWLKYEQIRKFLAVFSNVTNSFSGTTYPTSNIFLPSVICIKQLLLEELCSTHAYIASMAMVMKIKFDKYWSECNLLMSIAAVLDPRLKLKFITYSFPKIYEPEHVGQKIAHVEAAISEIYLKYASDCASSSEGCTQESSSRRTEPSGTSSQFDCMSSFQDFVVATGAVQPQKSDLQVYLEEGLFVCNSEQFDALEWWKMNTMKFNTLSKMARDILSIPITTVASESAFSAGGRVLDDYRGSLSTKTVNALVCTSNWLRAAHNSAKTPLQELMEEENFAIPLSEL